MGTKDYDDAYKSARKMQGEGFDAQVFITTDWSNLNRERWYVVTAGVYYTKADANEMLPSVQTIYADAYVKCSGEYLGK